MWRGLWGLRELHGRGAGDDETRRREGRGDRADGWAGRGGRRRTGEFNVNVLFDNCTPLSCAITFHRTIP